MSCPICHGGVSENINGRAIRASHTILEDLAYDRRLAEELPLDESRAWGWHSERKMLRPETLSRISEGLTALLDITESVLQQAERCPHCEGLATEVFDRDGKPMGFMRRRSPLPDAEQVAEAAMSLIQIPVALRDLDLGELDRNWQGRTGYVHVEQTEELWDLGSDAVISAFNPHLLAALELNNLYAIVKNCLEAVGYGRAANTARQNFDRAAVKPLDVVAP